MKSEIKPNETEEIKRTYPYLGVAKDSLDNDLVVLFTSPGYGVLLTEGLCLYYGKYEDWEESDFNLFNDTITLSN